MTVETDGTRSGITGTRWWRRPDGGSIFARDGGTGSIGGDVAYAASVLRAHVWSAIQPSPAVRMKAAPYVERLAHWWRPIGRWLYVYSIPYYITSTLLRRIIASNVLGLLILFIGLTYIGRTNALLIEAKRESLTTQGEIIARTIAGGAFVDQVGGLRIDPDRLLNGSTSLASWRDDGLTSLEFSLPPERVSQILRKLIDRDRNRARVFARDFTLITDTDWLLRKGDVSQTAQRYTGKGPTKDFWTRALQWWLRTDLPVYRDLGTAPGSEYPAVPIALKGVTTQMLEISEAGQQILSVAIPIQWDQQPRGVLLLSTGPGELDGPIAKEQRYLFLLAGIAGIASLVASTFLARTVAGPIKQLSAKAENVTHNINARQDLPDYSNRRDEVGRLFRSFDAMTTALYARIENSEKFAADVAHELKNPLTAARSMSESLSYARTDEQRRQVIEQIQFELQRLNRLITDISNVSRLDAELARQETKVVDLGGVADRVVGSFRDILSADTRTVRLALDRAGATYPVEGHEGRLSQILTNLIDNAVSFSPANGEVAVEIARLGDKIVVTVDDVGPGMPPNKLEAVFERFYSDRPQTDSTSGKNSGLGLSICREIVKAHGGQIAAFNRYADGSTGARPGMTPVGARFRVELPAVVSARAAPHQLMKRT